MFRHQLGMILSIALTAFSQQIIAGAFYITEIGTPGSLGTAGAANPTNTFSAETDQTAQGVRFKGDFSNNFILFAGGTLRYVLLSNS